jgi:hypothetical protein
MNIKYEWKPITTNVDWDKLRTPEAIRAAIDESIAEGIGDFRQALGFSRKPSPEELAAENPVAKVWNEVNGG